jgi:hypothetical protein
MGRPAAGRALIAVGAVGNLGCALFQLEAFMQMRPTGPIAIINRGEVVDVAMGKKVFTPKATPLFH